VNFDDDSPAHTEHRRDPLKTLTNIVVAVAAVLGMVFSLDSVSKVAIFGAVALSFGALELVPVWLNERVERSTRIKDDAIASQEFPRLKQYVSRFGKFIDPAQRSTLHNIIDSEISATAKAELQSLLRSPFVQSWNAFWYPMSQRQQEHLSPLKILLSLIGEMHSLVWQYHQLCIMPIFEHMPAGANAILTREDRSTLSAFRDEHAAFIRDYNLYLEGLSQLRPALEQIPRFLPTSKPLS
jgi:hypothetical protein